MGRPKISNLDAISFNTSAQENKPVESEAMPKVDDSALMEKFLELEKLVEEMRNEKSARDSLDASAHRAPSIGLNGVQGVVAKFSIDPDDYRDVTPRVMDSPKFEQFAFNKNYRMTWDVNGITYVRNNVTYEEPRIEVQLWKHRYNENGERLQSMTLVKRLAFGVDSLTAKRVWEKLDHSEYPTVESAMEEYMYGVVYRFVDNIFWPRKVKKPTRRQLIENNRIVVVDGNDDIEDMDNVVVQDFRI